MSSTLDEWLLPHVTMHDYIDLTSCSSSSEDERGDDECMNSTIEVIDLTYDKKQCFTVYDNASNDVRIVYEHVESMVIVDEVPENESSENVLCGCIFNCTSSCINALMCVECCSSNCSVGSLCSNRWLDMQRPMVEVVYERELQFGVRACHFIKKNTVVIEYVGELMRLERYKVRVPLKTDTYGMETEDGFIIDARYKGNYARFINHSCVPNLIAVKRKVDFTRVFLVALRDIESQEMLSFDYGEHVFSCLCTKCKMEL